MTLTIRPFEEVDTPRLVAILAAVFGEYRMRFDPDGFDRDVYDVARRYAAPLGVFFTAEEDGRVLGFGGADLPRDGEAEIHRLYLDPKARGRGLGRRLVETIEAWARPRATTMTLWSDVRLSHAHDLYSRLGFRLTGQRPLTDPDKSIEFGFRRSLAAPRDDRPFDAALVVREPGRSDFERHRASMVAAAILDSRTLARLPDGGHALPSPRDLFATDGPVQELFQSGEILVGFAHGNARRLHPLFASRVG